MNHQKAPRENGVLFDDSLRFSMPGLEWRKDAQRSEGIVSNTGKLEEIPFSP